MEIIDINIDRILSCVSEDRRQLYYNQIQHLYNVEWGSGPVINMLQFLKDQNIKTIADIGANLGISLIKFYEFLSPFTECYCFEPDSTNFQVLNNIVSSLTGANIMCYNTGIYYGKTEALVKSVGADTPNESPGGYFLDVLEPDAITDLGPTSYFDNKVFKLTELETIIKTPLDLIKLDVEGSEYNIIKNSSLLKQSKFLLVEFHNNSVSMISDFIAKYLPQFNIIQQHQNTYLLTK